MRDEERIEMYYKFGLLDWKNEQQLHNIKITKCIKGYSGYLWMILVAFLKNLKRLKDI